jgi:hypothetical protein
MMVFWVFTQCSVLYSEISGNPISGVTEFIQVDDEQI